MNTKTAGIFIIAIAFLVATFTFTSTMQGASASFTCKGNPHDKDSGPHGNPHDKGESGNPHDFFGSDICPGSK